MTVAHESCQVVATVPARVGLCADVTTALLGTGVKIVGTTMYDTPHGAQIFVMADDNDLAAAALERLGASVRIVPTVVLEIPDELGALDEAMHRISEAGINIDSMYMTTSGGDTATVLLHTSDDERVVEFFQAQ